MTPAHPVSPEEVMALADGELDRQSAARVRAHVDSCPECQALAHGFGAVSLHLAEWTTEPPTAGISLLRDRVTDRAASVVLRPLLGAIGVGVAVLVIAIYANVPSAPPAAPSAEARPVLSGSPAVLSEDFVAAWRAQRRIAMDLPPSDAKVGVVMFVDWLCPACIRDWPETVEVVQQYERTHPGMVRLVVKDYASNSACNPGALGTIKGHEGSCDAAVAVRIADEMGRRDQTIEWLVANQRQIGGAPLSSALIRDHVAQTLGIADFERRYVELLPALIADANAAWTAEIMGTPQWLVNGVHLPSLDVLDMAIRAELNHSDAPDRARRLKR